MCLRSESESEAPENFHQNLDQGTPTRSTYKAKAVTDTLSKFYCDISKKTIDPNNICLQTGRMSERRRLVYSIIQFVQEEIKSEELSDDAKESLEVTLSTKSTSCTCIACVVLRSRVNACSPLMR